ncbi:MAG TPA: hypothetical protein VFF79_12925 [Conexibacter sp.]|jgi:hypothetical protein|nr:hypothetical protein [Conexibacter sp.]
MREHDPLLHEVATALRDLSARVVAVRPDVSDDDRWQAVDDATDRAEAVLARVVEREGDIVPPPAAPA